MHKNPHLYEINTPVFLNNLSQRLGNKISLANVPDGEWQSINQLGFDYIWLMGVWKRSPRAREEALLNTGLQVELGKALPGWTAEDVGGSPYAIQAYKLDPMLGDEGDLSTLKSKLNSIGSGLILDFVPNHIALDHPWVNLRPDWFVKGTMTDAMSNPDLFYLSDNNAYVAHGRDPNFPPWTDTVQFNILSHDLRLALVDELLQIATVADGVRCDMAMLVLNDIFKKTWSNLIKEQSPVDTEFWTDIITAVKKEYPGFIFIAEAYWGLEPELLRIGFDFVYDKTLYECVRNASVAEIKRYIITNAAIMPRSVHFIENHDEQRAALEFGAERSQAAAVIATTLPGMHLYYDGQFQGKRIRMPVQLLKGPAEPVNEDLQHFYNRILSVCSSAAFHDGEWSLLEAEQSWENNVTFSNILAWVWRYQSQLKIVVINYSPHQSQARIKLPVPLPNGERVPYIDELTGIQYSSPGEEINTLGLYVDLTPWGCHLLAMPVAAS